jgi:hypothetical protein
MFECKECGRGFQDYISLGSHIGQSHRILTTKGYYDKYLKKDPSEGICKNCGKETKFVYLTFGYNDCCSRKCSSKLKDYKKMMEPQRKKQTCKFCGKSFSSKIALSAHINHPNSIHKDEVKKIKEEENKKKKINCELCNRNFEDLRTLGIHISLFHDNGNRELIEDYYNLYYKKNENEGICNCGNKIKFANLNYGYYKHCSTKCAKLDPEVELKSKETCLKNHGVTNYAKSKEWLYQMSEGGQAARMLTFVQNPSKPQCEILDLTKELFPDAIINFQILNYSADIAIPSLKIVIEYNGEYWHRNREEYDNKRKQKIEEEGWRVLIYKGEVGLDIIPSKEQILNDINGIILK